MPARRPRKKLERLKSQIRPEALKRKGIYRRINLYFKRVDRFADEVRALTRIVDDRMNLIDNLEHVRIEFARLNKVFSGLSNTGTALFKNFEPEALGRKRPLDMNAIEEREEILHKAWRGLDYCQEAIESLA